MNLNVIGANQTVVTFSDNTQLFYSYNTPVAAFIPGEGYIVTATKYSRTTTRHINNFTGGLVDRVESQSFFDNLVKTA
ncbi:hypothetical protein [Salmonella phage SSBI34]|nr:hypothetical protein [Salmonella phage SSBI34]